jgi:hypothetical protein
VIRYGWLLVLVLGVFVGGAHSLGGQLVLEQPDRQTHLTIAPVSYETQAFDPPPYYSYRLTYFQSRTSRWGLEGELIHLKVLARARGRATAQGTLNGQVLPAPLDAGQIVSNFEMSHGLNFTLLNVIYRTPPQRQDGSLRRVSFAGRAGVGPTLPHVEANILGASRRGFQLGKPGFQAASGIELRLAARLAVATEYKLTYTSQRVGVVDGHVSARVLTHHGVVGLVVSLTR